MRLTPRERQIAELVAKGMPNKVIAFELGVSLKTVEAHLQNAAHRIEGTASPRHKMILWFYDLSA